MIKELLAENFLSIGSINIENLDDMDIIGVMGEFEDKPGYSNASGKSSLVETFYFAYTGKHRYKTDIEVMRIGTDRTRVRLLYVKENDKLIIDRMLKKKPGGKSTASTVVVKLNGEIVASGTVPGQKYINEYFSITPDDFLASYFFRQKEFDTLLRVRSGQRIKFLQKFFKSYIFDDAKKYSSQERNKSMIELQQLEGKVGALREEKEDMTSETILKSSIGKLKKDIAALEENKKEYDEGVKIVENKINVAIKENAIILLNRKKKELYNSEIRDVNSEIGRVKVSVNKYFRSIAELNKKIINVKKEISLMGGDWSITKENQLSNLKDKIDDNLVTIAINNKNISLFSTAIENLKYSLCPVCSHKISKNTKEEQTKLKIKGITDLQTENNSLSESMNIKNEKLCLLKKTKKKMENNRLEKQSKLNLQQTCEIKLKGNKDMADTLSGQVNELGKRLSKFEKKKSDLGKVTIDDSVLNKLNKVKDKISEKIKSVQVDISEENTKLTHKVILLDRVKELGKKLKRMNIIGRALRKSIADRFLLEEIFQKCKMEVISTGIEELEEYANNIIKEIGAIHKEITFEREKETQAGDVTDALDIYLIDEKGKRLIDGLSGGEWDLSAFALKASLARYKLARMNSIIDFMVLDEIFGALDENSREELIKVINFMRNDFSQVFVTTHTSLKDIFEYNINVEMTKKGVTRLKEYTGG